MFGVQKKDATSVSVTDSVKKKQDPDSVSPTTSDSYTWHIGNSAITPSEETKALQERRLHIAIQYVEKRLQERLENLRVHQARFEAEAREQSETRKRARHDPSVPDEHGQTEDERIKLSPGVYTALYTARYVEIYELHGDSGLRRAIRAYQDAEAFLEAMRKVEWPLVHPEIVKFVSRCHGLENLEIEDVTLRIPHMDEVQVNSLVLR